MGHICSRNEGSSKEPEKPHPVKLANTSNSAKNTVKSNNNTVPQQSNPDLQKMKNSHAYRALFADFYNNLGPETHNAIKKDLHRQDYKFDNKPTHTKEDIKKTVEYLLHFKVYSIFHYTEGEGMFAHHFIVLFLVGTLNGEFTHKYLSMEKFDDCIIFIEAKDATDLVVVRPARKSLFVPRKGAKLVGCLRVLGEQVE